MSQGNSMQAFRVSGPYLISEGQVKDLIRTAGKPCICS